MAKLKIHPNPSKTGTDEFNTSIYPKSGVYISNSSVNTEQDWLFLVSKEKNSVILVDRSALEAAVEDSFEDSNPVPEVQQNLGLSINDVLRLIAVKSDSANIEDILEK